MRPRDEAVALRLKERLEAFEEEVRPLPGIESSDARSCLLEQMLESVHRVMYPGRLLSRPISPKRADPGDEMFDPIRAAVLHARTGNLDEACWLVFLFVHFGKHSCGGWRYLRDVYGKCAEGGRWDWVTVSVDPGSFRDWMEAHADGIRNSPLPGGFGNHRKYESLNGLAPTGTGEAVATYVEWVRQCTCHAELFAQAMIESNGNPLLAFDHLYRSMTHVARFGRTARFDYLTMLGKLKLCSIAPPSTYLLGATGPLRGGRLLFGLNAATAQQMEKLLVKLDNYIRVGPQVIEDAICNWQKSPTRFQRFRG